MRRIKFARAASALVLFMTVACAPPMPAPAAVATVAPNAAPTKITASYSERVGNYTVLFVALDQGIFARHGLDVDLQLIPGSTGMSALLSGQVQIAQIGASEVISAEASGSDLVMSGNLGAVLPYVFIVTPDIQTIDDLRGKHVGISTVGGSADIATRLRNQFIDRQLAALIQRLNQPEAGEAERLELLQQQQRLRALKRQPI